MTAEVPWLAGLRPDNHALMLRLEDGVRRGLVAVERMDFGLELIRRGEDPVIVLEALLSEAGA